jgi:hypothetical protein
MSAAFSVKANIGCRTLPPLRPRLSRLIPLGRATPQTSQARTAPLEISVAVKSLSTGLRLIAPATLLPMPSPPGKGRRRKEGGFLGCQFRLSALAEGEKSDGAFTRSSRREGRPSFFLLAAVGCFPCGLHRGGGRGVYRVILQAT